MVKRIRIGPGKSVRDEKGQVLILVLILLLLGALIITPLLGYMSTGLKTGQVFEKKTDELYAADAGIEDAVWHIRYDYLTGYSPYNYADNLTYGLSEQVNGKDVIATIKNVWIPKDIATPGEDQARAIIETGKLIVTGSIPPASTTYQIKITYYKGQADAPLQVETLGVWLPPGFTYVNNSSNLQNYLSSENVTTHCSGQAIIWTFDSYPFVGDNTTTPKKNPFPGVKPADRPIWLIRMKGE